MDRIISIDPSGTGTSGIFFTDGELTEFQEFNNINWKEHYKKISLLIKYYKPNLLLFENTNFINSRNKDSLSLLRLLGAIDCLPIKQIASVNVLKVKELSKSLLKGQTKIDDLEYQIGRGKGWMFNNKRISIHCLEAYLVYWVWNKDKNKT